MDLFTITSSAGKKIAIVPATDKKFHNRKIQSTDAFTAEGDFGEMLFQRIGFRYFDLWYSYYHMFYEMIFLGEVGRPVLEAHITLRDQYVQSLGKKKETICEAGLFNLTGAPYMKNKAFFPKNGEYASFDIHPSRSLLENLAQDFPELDQFMNMLDSNVQEPVSLYKTPLFISPTMNHLIYEILTLLKSPTAEKSCIEILINELMIQLITRSKAIRRPKWKLTKKDTDALHEARKFIIQEGKQYDFDDLYDTVIQLADKTGLSFYKFKRGFTQLFDISPYHLLKEVRLYKAKELLKDRTYSIYDIALNAGYQSLEGFSKAYKNRFHISPSADRK